MSPAPLLGNMNFNLYIVCWFNNNVTKPWMMWKYSTLHRCSNEKMYSSNYRCYTTLQRNTQTVYVQWTCDWLEHKCLISGFVFYNATCMSSSTERSLFICFNFVFPMAKSACSHRYVVEIGRSREMIFSAKLRNSSLYSPPKYSQWHVTLLKFDVSINSLHSLSVKSGSSAMSANSKSDSVQLSFSVESDGKYLPTAALNCSKWFIVL